MLHSILDISHLEIHARQESDPRRSNLPPSSPKTKLFIYHGRLMAAGFEGELLAELDIFHQSLHVTYQYEISTGDGKEISANAWKGKKNWTLDCYLPPPPTQATQKSMVKLAGIPHIHLQTLYNSWSLLRLETRHLYGRRPPHRISILKITGQGPKTIPNRMAFLSPPSYKTRSVHPYKFHKDNRGYNLQHSR